MTSMVMALGATSRSELYNGSTLFESARATVVTARTKSATVDTARKEVCKHNRDCAEDQSNKIHDTITLTSKKCSLSEL